jgi:hypothetical protein
MTDGFLLGWLMGIGGILGGVLIAESYHARQDARDGNWRNIVQQQQTRIDALEQYIEDHSDGDDEGELRRMFGGTDD